MRHNKFLGKALQIFSMPSKALAREHKIYFQSVISELCVNEHINQLVLSPVKRLNEILFDKLCCN